MRRAISKKIKQYTSAEWLGKVLTPAEQQVYLRFKDAVQMDHKNQVEHKKQAERENLGDRIDAQAEKFDMGNIRKTCLNDMSETLAKASITDSMNNECIQTNIEFMSSVAAHHFSKMSKTKAHVLD